MRSTTADIRPVLRGGVTEGTGAHIQRNPKLLPYPSGILTLHAGLRLRTNILLGTVALWHIRGVSKRQWSWLMPEHLDPNPASASLTASKSAPVLSVGIPVYNGGKWIAEAIESILVQSVSDLELIIADNASTDDTEAICLTAAASDPRVKYHRNTSNIGLHRNFDRAFELSTGKYFKWAADSDFCLEGFFEQCVAVLEERPDVVLAYPKTILLFTGPGGVELTQEYDDLLELEDARPSTRYRNYLDHERINNVMHGIIRSSELRKTSLIRPMPASDISMIAELVLRGKIVQVPEYLFVRRFDEETSSMMMNAEKAAERDVPMGRTPIQRIELHAYRYIAAIRAPIALSERLRVCLYLTLDFSTLPFRAIRKLARILLFRR